MAARNGIFFLHPDHTLNVVPANAGTHNPGRSTPCRSASTSPLASRIIPTARRMGPCVRRDDVEGLRSNNRHTFAISRRVSPELCRKFPCPPIRGRGECRAPDAPDSRVCNGGVVERTRVSQVTPESPGIPHAMVYGLYVISPAIGFLATVTCGTDRRLDISTEMSGQHDFVVRLGHARLARLSVHRSPSLRS